MFTVLINNKHCFQLLLCEFLVEFGPLIVHRIIRYQKEQCVTMHLVMALVIMQCHRSFRLITVIAAGVSSAFDILKIRIALVIEIF